TRQVEKIKELENDIIETNLKLEHKKNDKIQLMTRREKEKETLSGEKQEKKNVIELLKDKEDKLKKDIRDKERIANQLVNEIKKMIEEENKKRKGLEMLTPAEKVISTDFKKNMGRLPWPTRKGIVTGYFGEHNHPVFGADVKISNNGIDITTTENSDVRAIFGGKVSKVIAILGANNTVVIRHGNYISVYQNLVDVTVKAGDEVKIKDKIGIVAKNKNGEYIVHIEIWEEYKKLNPIDWLSK
ncbi:MAG: murein hydrolase activator EnvC family protein, partial [bacterium]